MFYPEDSLKRGGRFYLCWVADSWPMRFAAITHRQLWSHDIRKLCDDLLEVMTNESGRPSNRFSLRLSSQLMRGLVRLYERKATVLLGDLCMIHATVFKSTNRKCGARDTHERPLRRLPQLPPPAAVAPEEPENEKQLEEMIQNSGNVVINIQDITLKEATIPDFQLPPNDNFGEENPEQPIQNLLADRTIEQMMQETSGAQTSGLDLLEPVTDQSHDKWRFVHDAPQMEAVSDVDITLARKSAAEDQLPAFEKDVPEIPEIPLPDLPVPIEPVPPPVMQVTEQQDQEVIPEEEQPPPTEVLAPAVADKRRKESGAGDVELEELEERPLAKKRRMRPRLIIDKKIRLTADYLRARIENPYVELRCEDPEDAIIDLRTPTDILLRRPGHDGTRIQSRMTPVLSFRFYNHINLLADRQPERREPDMEQPRQRRPRSSITALQKTPEIEEQQIEIPAPQRPEMDMTRRATEGPEAVHIPDLNLTTAGLDVTAGVVDASKDPVDVIGEVARVEPQAPAEDIADLPTQKLETLSQAEKRPSQVESPRKRHKLDGHQSFRESQRATSAPNKENIPPNIPSPQLPQENIPPNIPSPQLPQENIPPKIPSPQMPQENIPPNIISPQLPPLEQSEAEATRMLREAGLCEEYATDAIQPVEQAGTRKDQSEGSETPMGSLDRTKVSLGDSEKTTDSQKFMRREWGLEGTMLKIMRRLRFGGGPVTVSALLARGPLRPGKKAIIAARCFNSILRLKQNGFIRVLKDAETLEILDIDLGPRFDYLMQI